MSDYSINPNSPTYDCGSDVRAIELTGSDGKSVNGWIRLGPEKSQVCVADNQCADVATQSIQGQPKAAKPTDGQNKTCQKFRPESKPKSGSVLPALGLTAAALSCGGSYAVDLLAAQNLSDIPSDHGLLEDVGNWGHFGLTTGCVGLYNISQRHQKPVPYWVANGISGGGSVGFLIGAFAKKPHQGTPELNLSMTLGTNAAVSLVCGHEENSNDPVRFGLCVSTQLALSAVGIGLGAAGVSRGPEPLDPEKDSSPYVDPSIAPGSLAPGSPYEDVRFTNLDKGLLYLGIAHGVSAAVNLADYLLITGPKKSSDEKPATDPKKKASSFQIRPVADASLDGSFMGGVVGVF